MVDIIGLKNDKKIPQQHISDHISVFTDYKIFGLDYVCERVYKYEDFVDLMKKNERLELCIFIKLRNIGVIKKTGRNDTFKYNYYDTLLPKKVRTLIIDWDSEDEWDMTSYENKERLHKYLFHLTSYDGEEYIYELIEKQNYFKKWNRQINNTNNELIVKLFNKKEGIDCNTNNNTYKKTKLYKELQKRRREKAKKYKITKININKIEMI